MEFNLMDAVRVKIVFSNSTFTVGGSHEIEFIETDVKQAKKTEKFFFEGCRMNML
jgi:hypothetical protein